MCQNPAFQEPNIVAVPFPERSKPVDWQPLLQGYDAIFDLGTGACRVPLRHRPPDFIDCHTQSSPRTCHFMRQLEFVVVSESTSFEFQLT